MPIPIRREMSDADVETLTEAIQRIWDRVGDPGTMIAVFGAVIGTSLGHALTEFGIEESETVATVEEILEAFRYSVEHARDVVLARDAH